MKSTIKKQIGETDTKSGECKPSVMALFEFQELNPKSKPNRMHPIDAQKKEKVARFEIDK